MKISSLLQQKSKKVHTVKTLAPVGEAVKILNDEKIGALVVVNDSGDIQGIISERDILRKTHEFQGKIFALTVKSVMTPKSKLITASSEEEIGEAMGKMTEKRVRHLPVLDNGKLVGIVSIGDIIKFLLNTTEIENEGMKNYISGKY